MNEIAEGIPKIPQPRDVHVGLEPGWPEPVLIVEHAEGTIQCHPISKDVAAILIAYSFYYEG